MTRMRKVRAVAAFEFLTAVRRPGYLLTTFGMPLFIAAYAAVVAIPAYYAQQQEEAESVYGVLDRARVLGLTGDAAAPKLQLSEELKGVIDAMGQRAAVDAALERSNFVFRPCEAEEQCREALANRSIKGYFVLPPDYLQTGRVEIYRPDRVSLSGGEARTAFGNLLRERLVANRMDRTVGQRVVSPMADARRYAVTGAGEVTDGGQIASAVRLAVPLVFIVLFLMSVLMTSGYLMQGTATEKENKVVEVLLASANPDEILAGKLLGLGGAGLLQISVWLVMALATGLGIVPLLLASGIPIPWLAVSLAVPLFVVSFLFFGSLILGTGSLGANMREAQQLAMVWSLMSALPLMMLSLLIAEPHGTLARVLTWIPFSAGQIIIFRASMDPGSLAWWEVAGSIAVLVISTRVALGLGARLFRVGLLSTGSRPSFREIVRQARLT